MLAQWPPTIIIHFFKITLWAFKQRDIFFHPFRSFGIGNCLNNIFIFHAIERFGIMTKVCIFQKSGRSVLISGRSLYIGYTIFCQWFLSACIGQIIRLVGRSIHSRECTHFSGTESNPFNRCYRSIKHTQPYPLTIHIHLNITIGSRKNCFYMISLSRFIFHHIRKTWTTFHTENAVRSEFQSRTGNAVLIQEINLKYTFIILSCQQIKWDFQFFRSRNLTFYLRIVEGIFIL